MGTPEDVQRAGFESRITRSATHGTRSHYAMFSVDVGSGRITAANAACEGLLGLSPEVLVGARAWDLLLRAEDRDVVVSELDRPDAPDNQLLGRTRPFVLLGDGERLVDVELTTTLDRREPATVTCLIRDPDEMSLVARSAALASTAANLTSVGTFEWDLEHDRGTFSDAMYAIHGLEPCTDHEALSFEHYLDLVHPEDRATLLEEMMATRVEGTVSPASRWRIVRPTGETRQLMSSIAPLVWENGQIVKVIGTVQDVTDRWMADVELRLHAAVSEGIAAWDEHGEGASGLLRAICEATGWSMGTLMTVDRTTGTLSCNAQWARPDLVGGDYQRHTADHVFRSGEGLPGRVWANGTPLSVWEMMTAEPTAGVRPWTTELAGVLAFRVSHPGHFEGVMEFVTEHAGPLDDGLRRALTAIGLQIGDFLGRHRAELGDSPISRREREVLQLAAHGGTTASIAAELVVSPSTVKTHFEKIYGKLGVSDRAEAVAEAFRRGLVT